MDFVRRFFGLSNGDQQLNETFQYQEDDVSRIPKPYYGDSEIREKRGFDVFTDPLQMHQYFEQQMNEVLKTFGFSNFEDGVFSEFNVPTIESKTKINDNESCSGELRDQFLKSGYEKPTQKLERADKDIDEKVKIGDLDSVFGRKSNVNPYKRSTSEGFFFGQSHSIKTIRNADGSIETHRTVRDNEGNEEVTVCHKIGNKEYCTIKKKDKYGREEITENFNITENEKNDFFKPKISSPPLDDQHKNDFPFDHFFH